MNAPQAVEGEYRVVLLPATRRDGQVIVAFLTRHNVQCELCPTAAAAAMALTMNAGVLVLTDQVFGRPGAHLISDALSHQAGWSDIPVVFLSKVGEESSALADMVSRMTNVTLLDRPASARTLLSTIQAALRSRGKQYQIRDQLEALHKAERALRESDRRKDEFLAMLAHELRNPLASIRTASEVLRRLIVNDDARVSNTVGIVRRQTLQLTRLVDDLLDVSRITQGRIEIQRAPVDLSTVVGHALESVEPQIKDKRHCVRTDIATGVFVMGDSARLMQCVSNLLTNAVKYTEAGGQIAVKLALEGEQAVLTVSDNGIGIPAELLPRVFDLFVQNERALDRAQGGLGIGLSVVRRLLEMQGGEVSASSAGPGRGSSFRVVLPAVAALDRVPPPQTETNVAPLKVLVVDDNVDAADSLTTLLSMDGHFVQAVYEGRTALKVVATFKPDLILLDIGLPSMSGYEVASRLRANGNQSMLVAVTGYGQQDDIERAVEAGFDAHVAKPVELSRLQEVLRSVLFAKGRG